MKKRIGIAALAFVLFVVLGAVLPFVRQPEVTERTKAAVAAEFFGGKDWGGNGVFDEAENSPAGDFSSERVAILSDNSEALAERIRLISQAEERIILSTFEFRSDESGKDILAALLAAAQRGVDVQVMADGMPSFLRLTGNEYFRALAAEETAEIRVYNPISVLKPWKLMGRMHDKYLIADDTAYILGGRNTYDYFLGDYGGYKNYDWDVLVWRDNLELARLETGGSMEQLVTYFKTVWESPESRPYHEEEKKVSDAVQAAGIELEQRYAAMKEAHPDWFLPCDYREKTMAANRIELVTNPVHPYAKEPVVFYTITELMKGAEKEVRFHTPYIIADDWMLARLAEVCGEVPEVFMMTNSVVNNGNPFGSMDYERDKGKILDTGVKILEYDGGVSYHGKCFVADERISGIGSFNWDMRSAYIDTEMMLLIDSEEVNAAFREGMGQYEAEALAVKDADSYYDNGLTPQEMTLKQRVMLTALRIFAGWARFLM